MIVKDLLCYKNFSWCFTNKHCNKQKQRLQCQTIQMSMVNQ